MFGGWPHRNKSVEKEKKVEPNELGERNIMPEKLIPKGTIFHCPSGRCLKPVIKFVAHVYENEQILASQVIDLSTNQHPVPESRQRCPYCKCLFDLTTMGWIV